MHFCMDEFLMILAAINVAPRIVYWIRARRAKRQALTMPCVCDRHLTVKEKRKASCV